MAQARRRKSPGSVGPGDGAGKPAPSTLSNEEQRAHAHEAALRILAFHARSVAEMRQKLKQKGYDRDVIEGILERLQETGLLNDAQYAERFANDATGMRSLGAYRVRSDLLKKGIDRDLAAVAATVDPDEEEARARQLAEVRAARMTTLTPEAKTRRLLSLLARRGYPADVCQRVARDVGGAVEGA